MPNTKNAQHKECPVTEPQQPFRGFDQQRMYE